jgi:RNA polymerase sigma factor (sigma-70 family)
MLAPSAIRVHLVYAPLVVCSARRQAPAESKKRAAADDRGSRAHRKTSHSINKRDEAEYQGPLRLTTDAVVAYCRPYRAGSDWCARVWHRHQHDNSIAALFARRSLILSLASYAVFMARKYKRPEHFDDLFQEGIIGCISAINKFGPDRGAKLTSLSHQYIRTRFKRYFDRLAPFTWNLKAREDKNGMVFRCVASYFEDDEDEFKTNEWVDDAPNQLDKLIAADLNQAMASAFVVACKKSLDDRERDVLDRIYRQGQTLRAVGEALAGC